MLEIAAKNMLRVPATWSLTPVGIGTMAYHQRSKITLAQVLLVAESEDEFWSIADGWAEAQGCDAYTSEMIRELEEAAPVRMSWERDDYFSDGYNGWHVYIWNKPEYAHLWRYSDI